MNLKNLRYFVTIVDEGSISKAAEKLYMTQPPLSHQLKQLEDEYGTQLFVRNTREIKVTEAGKLLYMRALQLLDLADITNAEINDFVKGEKGTLRIGFVASTAGVIIPDAILAFHKDHPHYDFRLYEGSTHKILDLVDQGTIDIGLVKSPFNLSNYCMRPLSAEPMITISKKPLKASHTKSISIHELVDYPIIIDKRFEDLIMKAYQKENYLPNIVCRGEDSRTLITMAISGIGVAILPQSAKSLLGARDCFSYTITAPSLETETIIAWSKSKTLSVIAEEFLSLLACRINNAI